MTRQTTPFSISPETGETIASTTPEQWRDEHKGCAWLFNPWTGQRRTPQEVGYDVFGWDIDDGTFSMTKILYALRNGMNPTQIMFMMQQQNIHIDAPVGDNGETPIMIAAYHGHEDCVKALVCAGADLHAVSKQGVTFLAYASRHAAVLGLLKDTDAFLDVNKTHEPYFFTPLMQAINISTGNSLDPFDSGLVDERIECIRMLMEAGADIDAVNSFGRTAIMGAAATGSKKLVKALLEYSPRLDIRCKEGKRAIDFTGDSGIKTLLRPFTLVAANG